MSKTPDPSSVPETGGDVEYTVTVTNTSQETVTLVSLVDDVFGSLAGKGDSVVGGDIAPGATYSCAFTESIAGPAGTTHDNLVTAGAEDDEGTDASDSDDASVAFDNVDPVIVVTKTADPESVPETGGDVVFTVSVLNDGPGGGSNSCSFTRTLSGAPGTSHINEVTAIGKDDEGNTDSATATATVTFVAT